MKTLMVPLVLLLPLAARAQQAAPTLDKLEMAGEARGAALAFDGSKAGPAAAAVDVSTGIPAMTQADDTPMVVTPVVKVKPRQVVFEKWAAGEGGRIGLTYGVLGGALAGLVAGTLLLGPLGPLAAVAIGLGILAAGAVAGWLVGRNVGASKAKELKAS